MHNYISPFARKKRVEAISSHTLRSMHAYTHNHAHITTRRFRIHRRAPRAHPTRKTATFKSTCWVNNARNTPPHLNIYIFRHSCTNAHKTRENTLRNVRAPARENATARRWPSQSDARELKEKELHSPAAHSAHTDEPLQLPTRLIY